MSDGITDPVPLIMHLDAVTPLRVLQRIQRAPPLLELDFGLRLKTSSVGSVFEGFQATIQSIDLVLD